MNIYELILVCPWIRYFQMISETAYGSQTKFKGESLHVSEHGIGYLNFTFEAKKGQNRLILGFKPLKSLEGLESQSYSINIKEFVTKTPLEIGNLYLAFIADEGHKGQNLIFAI